MNYKAPTGGAEDLLKSRIMSIMDQTLNKGSTVSPTTPLPQAVPQHPDLTTTKPMLQDPNIQKALNNLLSGGNFNFFN